MNSHYNVSGHSSFVMPSSLSTCISSDSHCNSKPKSMDGVLSSSEDVFKAFMNLPNLGAQLDFVSNNHISCPVPALKDAFGLKNTLLERKIKPFEDLSLEVAPAIGSNLATFGKDTAPHVFSQLERRREQNREAQRRFRLKARRSFSDNSDNEAKLEASAGLCTKPIEMSLFGKRMRDCPISFPVALPKVDIKLQGLGSNNTVGFMLAHFAQSAPSQRPSIQVDTPTLPVNDIQTQILKLKMQIAKNMTAQACGGIPTAQDEAAAAPENPEQESDFVKIKKTLRVQNREAQRRHRMRLRQEKLGCDGTNVGTNDTEKNASLDDFLTSSVKSIHVPSPAQLDTSMSPQTNTQKLWQISRMLSLLGGSAPMAGLSI